MHCKELETLNLTECDLITEYEIMGIINVFKFLRTLVLPHGGNYM